MKTFGDVLNGRTRTGKGRFVLASVLPLLPPPSRHRVHIGGRVEKGEVYPRSTHRVATAAFWSTFHHDGKIRPFHYTVFTITYKVAEYAQAERADTLPVFHLNL
jgi:hypothetical protein